MKTRSIRESGYKDYFAIDEVGIKDGRIINTILYLKRGEGIEIKMRYDTVVYSAGENHSQSWMEPH